jgi:hypothetical protein
MGLVPLDTIDRDEARAEGDPIDPRQSRMDQVDYLFEYLKEKDNRFLVRAHCPTAIARLLDGQTGEGAQARREQAAKDFMQRISKRSKEEKEIQQSCVQALSLLGDNDEDPLDVEIRKVVFDVPKSVGDQQARHFGMIAAGRLGGTVGTGKDAGSGKGIDEITKHLSTQLSKGKSSLRPWAGLAMGVMGWNLNKSNEDHGVGNLSKALQNALRDEKANDKVGAYAIAVGILGDTEAETILIDKLNRLKDDEARGYVAVGLGLMNSRAAIEPIQAIVTESKYRPELLKQAAIGLGLLGDKELVNDLLNMLAEAKGLATQAAISSALGFIGDQRSIDPLVEMLQNKDITDKARGFAAVALGIVADKEPLPWNSKLAVDLNYRAATTTLNDTEGTGILNIL